MTITLKQLNNIDSKLIQELQNEHYRWITNYWQDKAIVGKAFLESFQYLLFIETIKIDLFKDVTLLSENNSKQWLEGKYQQFLTEFNNADHKACYQFNVLNYPQFWSGARIAERFIASKKVDRKSAYDIMLQLIDDIKSNPEKLGAKNKKEKQEIITAVGEFEKKYKKYITVFKERSLLLAIQSLINSLPHPKTLHKVFEPSHLHQLQTHENCLKAHKQLFDICSNLKSTNEEKKAVEKIKLIETLGMRYLDIYYQRVKKTTPIELTASALSITTSVIGFGTGLIALGLGLASIAVPVLALPATIVGLVSFVSYVATGISMVKIAYEASRYQRSPSPSETLEVAIDIVLAPLNIIGRQLVASAANIFHPLQTLLNAANFCWHDIINYLLPDAFYVHAAAKDSNHLVTALSKTGQLARTTSATQFKNVRSGALSQSSSSALIEKCLKLKTAICNDPQVPAHHQRAFVYLLPDLSHLHLHDVSKKVKEDKAYLPSQHGTIVCWDKGLFALGLTKQARVLRAAVKAYAKLPASTSPKERRIALQRIEQITLRSIHQHTLQKKNTAHLQTLRDAVDNEIRQLLWVEDKTVTLVGLKKR